jgi:hypothetical protein
MMTAKSPICDSLSNQLEICIQIQFTGRLDVETNHSQAWSLYFSMGRLLWACGGGYSLIRWRRLLLKHCHPLQDQIGDLAAVPTGHGYNLLLQWVKQQQITGVQAANVIRSAIAEVLFDILQQEKQGKLSYTTYTQDTLNASLSLVHPRQGLIQSQQEWAAWCHAGLDYLSPNLAPILRQPDAVQAQTSFQGYQTLVKVIDGKQTLRDLALLLNQDLLLLTRILLVYVRKGAIEWLQIPDLQTPAPDAITITPKHTVTSHQSKLLDQIPSPLKKELLQTIEPIAALRLQKILQETDNFLNEVETLALHLPAAQKQEFHHQLQTLMARLQMETPGADANQVIPISSVFLEQCQQKLIHYIGPIASYLIKKTLLAIPEISAQQLVGVLAAKIENPVQAQAFRDYLLGQLSE